MNNGHGRQDRRGDCGRKMKKEDLFRDPLSKSMGGDEGSRTLGLCHATAALSQLSYVPKTSDYSKQLWASVNEKS